MIRNLIRGFSKHLKISQFNKYETQTVFCTRNIQSNFHTSQNADDNTINDNINLEEQQQSAQNILETDYYVTPYHSKVSTRQIQLESKLKISKSELEELYEIDPKLKSDIDRFNLKKVIDIILENGITKESVIENPFILRMNADRLRTKISKLKATKYENINDLVPLLRVSEQRLSKIANMMNKESYAFRSHKNRIYYLSKKLNIEPKIVTKYLSRRLFMFWISLNSFIECLNYMLEYGIEPINILKDLWSFRYSPECIRERLKRANSAKKDKIMPWMIRCPERIFQKSLKLSLDEKQVLGEKNSIVDYLSQRLDFDVETTKSIMSKHPAVFRVRLKKVKEVLDYLLDEAGFSTYDIARVPRILCHKLETTKLRLEELKSHGCTPTSLIIVCKSKREYDKFLRGWIKMENIIKDKNSKRNE